MTKSQRAQALSSLLNTSVSDTESSLVHYSDPTLLCDLLLACRERGQPTREQIVRRRIARLIRQGVANGY
ncbi:MAG: hypothetical protein SV201_04835 [Pseudomonadota bacterium]|nr:hypothetical protein [Pseudomonadota bacterium]